MLKAFYKNGKFFNFKRLVCQGFLRDRGSTSKIHAFTVEIEVGTDELVIFQGQLDLKGGKNIVTGVGRITRIKYSSLNTLNTLENYI